MKQFSSVLFFLSLFACSSTPEQGGVVPATACEIIYDAGSSATRLHIYQQTTGGWVKHSGPKMAALADPVRGNRNRTMADADGLTDSIVAALEGIRKDGPAKKDGGLQWEAFDWQTHCHVGKAAVYATAGMRLAEKTHPANAELLWEMLNRKLGAALGIEATTRTLTGFEEGLYAWLATREKQADGHFGVAEMGGASVQVSFPCSTCESSRNVIVQGSEVQMVSFSFLGMGQDEAWKKLGNRQECKRGVGLENPTWKIADCSDGFEIPLYVAQEVRAHVDKANVQRWYLAGAFGYSMYSDVDSYCHRDMDSGYQPQTSCFRAVYQPYFLYLLGVPISSGVSEADWTLGPVLCAASDCFAKAGPPECQWSDPGCVE